jgi:GNAT superfamily N-acetyltransferase
MTSEISVIKASAEDFERVGGFVHDLLIEIFPDEGYQRTQLIASAKTLLAGDMGIWAFLAVASEEERTHHAGVITLNECAAIYSGGCFGEISEFYVVPEFRSEGVGALLLDTAVAFGQERGWPNIEVGAPSRPTWQRTIDFYLGRGFVEVGPRLDLTLQPSESNAQRS